MDDVPARNAQTIVGQASVKVVGLAPRSGLQGIHGENWPLPPWQIEYVTYCYLDEVPQAAFNTAEERGATLRTENVRVDGGRTAHLIYHAKDAHLDFVGQQLICILVHEIVGTETDPLHAGEKYLSMVHLPANIPKEQDMQFSQASQNAVKREGLA